MGVDRGQVKPIDAGANEMMNAPDSTADKCNGLRLLIWVETALLTSKTFTQTQSTNRSEAVAGQVVINCLMAHDKDKIWEVAKEKQNHTQRSQVKGGVGLVLTVPLTGGGKPLETVMVMKLYLDEDRHGHVWEGLSTYFTDS